VAEAFSCQSNFNLTEDRAYIIQFISGAQTSNTSGTELQILCDFTKLKIFRLVLSIKWFFCILFLSEHHNTYIKLLVGHKST